MPDLTPREHAAREALIAEVLARLVRKFSGTKRTAAEEVFTTPGQREPAQLEGIDLGTVRLDKAAADEPKVVDADAFLAWCKQHAPEHVYTVTEEKVSPGYQKALLKRWAETEHEDDWISQDGEDWSPQGIAMVPQKPRLVVTPSKTAESAVLAALGDRAAVLGLEPKALEG